MKKVWRGRLARGFNGVKPATCLAYDGGELGRQEQVGTEVLDEIVAALSAGGRQAGEGFPGAFAGVCSVSAGELSGDDGRT